MSGKNWAKELTNCFGRYSNAKEIISLRYEIYSQAGAAPDAADPRHHPDGQYSNALMSTASDYQNSFAATLLSGVLGLIIFGSILILVAFAVISSIIVFVRYYKHFFSDEGYLTHTLPVKTSTHMFSKTWSTLLWVIITTVAVLFFVFLYVLIGSAPPGALC